jgi:DNA polymerase-4
VIETEDLPDCLYGLELRDLCGIGARIERRLFLHGIVTVRQLCAASLSRLRNVWGGVEGERMYSNLRGEVVLRPPTHRASLSHSHILPPHERNPKLARATLCRLLQKAATRLRKMNYAAAELCLYLKFLDRETWSDKIRFSHTCETALLTREMLVLWQRRPREYSAPLGVGVVLGRLQLQNQCSLSLFDPLDPGRIADRAMDEINARFGPMTLYLGGAHEALSTSDPPIAFNHIPELIVSVPLSRHAH